MQTPHGFSLAILTGFLLLSGCYSRIRLQEIGDVPNLTRTQDPTAYPDYHPVQMPMPQTVQENYQPNSLWRTGARTFFKDQRASRVGDIVTVRININDRAQTINNFNASRDSKNAISLANFFGTRPKPILDTQTKPETNTRAQVNRNEQIFTSLAATVIQILPNGNLVISGRQEMRINFEIRDLILTGVVRTEDISSTNEIPLEKIAEARVSYGGRGQLSDLQQIPAGQQVLNQILPF